MQIVYSRVATASQSLLRQRHILTEAGLLVRTEGVAQGIPPRRRRPPLRGPRHHLQDPRPGPPRVGKIAAKAYPGDTPTVSAANDATTDLIITSAGDAFGSRTS
ncbi:hypothetical protein ACIA8R_45550 [Nonomuraea sp. NPDC051191]|uniref:hypothetical protein n=1 Tax=Nonomuraea sp. NPDC051191 TaxID=3364372 RepID=UPI00378B089D